MAAWRAGLVGWWAPAAVTVAVLVHFGLPVVLPAVELALLVVLTAVLGYLGLRVLRMTDVEWGGVPAVAAPVPVRA